MTMNDSSTRYEVEVFRQITHAIALQTDEVQQHFVVHYGPVTSQDRAAMAEDYVTQQIPYPTPR